MDTKFYRIVRFLAWPLIVIVALNIEAWADANGFATLLGANLPDRGFLAVAYNLLTSSFVTHLAAFLTGAVVLTWMGYWFERIEDKHPDGPPLWIHTPRLLQVALMLKKRQERRHGYPLHYNLERANKSLSQLGFEQLPAAADDLWYVRDESIEYLDAIYTLLEKKQVEAARSLGATYSERITRKLESRQLQSGSESEKPQ